MNPALGMVAGHDFHTRRVYLWTLEGKPIASFDGVGENILDSLAIGGGALWLQSWQQHSGRHSLYRPSLPSQLRACFLHLDPTVQWSSMGGVRRTEVEELVLQRGIIVSHETVRRWCGKFGQAYAHGPCPKAG